MADNQRSGETGGSRRPDLKNSLEELTRLADDLVDGLSDADPSGTEEITVDLTDDSRDPAAASAAAGDEEEIVFVDADAPDDFEIVDPDEQAQAESTREATPPTSDDGAALQETLDELDRIGQQEMPGVQRFEVEFAGDKGQDIDAHLDTLFGSDPVAPKTAEPTEATAEPIEQPVEEEEIEIIEEPIEAETVEVMAALVAPAAREEPIEADVETPEPLTVRPEIPDVVEQGDLPERGRSIFDEIEERPRPAADKTEFKVAVATDEAAVAAIDAATATDGDAGLADARSGSKKWLAITVVIVVVAAVAAWMFFSPATDVDPITTAPVETGVEPIVPEPVELPAPTVESEPATPVETPVRTPVESEPSASFETGSPAAAGSEPATPVETRTPPPVKATTPSPVKAEPKPTVKATTPPPVKAEPKPTVKTTAPPPVKAEPKPTVKATTPPPVKAEPKPTVKATTPPPAKAEPKPTVKTTAPPPVKAEPKPVQFEAPVVVSRTEPVLTKRLRNAEGTVTLNVLVNERGQVVRVVVGEGVPGSELERVSIDAVLRWEYRPATENGKPVRAWVTETFVFD